MEIELVAGENFPNSANTEAEQFIILNETAIKRMGLETPSDALGQIVTLGDARGLNLKIIGVAKDFYHDNIWFSSIQPYALRQGEIFKKN